MSRTYHETSSAYILPNDSLEHTRLNAQSSALHSLLGNRTLLSPLSSPARILEIGSGTGITLRHLLSSYPSAEVVGVDLSPLSPPIPDPRLTFLQGDFLSLAKTHPTLTQGGGFDFIFSRLLVYGMQNWESYISLAASLLKPGGWLELQEADQTYLDSDRRPLGMNEGERWMRRRNAAAEKLGLDFGCAGKLEGWMRERGLVEVRAERFRWVIGRWEGHPETDEIGRYSNEYLPEMASEAYRRMVGGDLNEEELGEDERGIREFYSADDSEGGGEGRHATFVVVCGRKA